MPSQVFSARLERGRYEVSGPTHVEIGRRLDGDGVFAAWTWDGERLTVERDRSGLLPLFYTAGTDAIAVSTSIDALLASGVSAALDDGAIAVFLRAGFFVGDDTPFAAIRALPPGRSWTWTAHEGVRIADGWTPPAAVTRSRKEAIDRFSGAFITSMNRRLAAATEPLVVPLTGGHDSRHILLALQELRRLPDRCVTATPYPPNAPDDVSIAAMLAATFGIPHDVLPRRTQRLAAEHEKNRITHYCADEHVHLLPLRDYFSEHPADVFDGLGGDVLSQSQRLDQKLHRAFVDGRFESVADRVLGNAEIIEPALQHLLTRTAAHRFDRARALARVAVEAARYADAPNPIAAFFFFTRMRREIALAPYALLDVCPVWTPFLDRDVVELLMSLPFDLVADRRLHTETLLARYPEFAHLPFAGKRQGPDDAAAVRRDAAGLVRLIVSASSGLVDAGGIVARSARAWFSPQSARVWFLPRVVHLLDVERLAEGRFSAPSRAAGARRLAVV
jgi:asparagine synthase (glutamine-hydrolysing)